MIPATLASALPTGRYRAPPTLGFGLSLGSKLIKQGDMIVEHRPAPPALPDKVLLQPSHDKPVPEPERSGPTVKRIDCSPAWKVVFPRIDHPERDSIPAVIMTDMGTKQIPQQDRRDLPPHEVAMRSLFTMFGLTPVELLKGRNRTPFPGQIHALDRLPLVHPGRPGLVKADLPGYRALHIDPAAELQHGADR